jgi:membrane-bound serine protease (ClpP class)
MRRVALFLCMFALALAWPSAASAAPSATIDVIKVEGALDRPLVGYLEHQLTEAEDAGAVVVLQLNTSGTLDQDALALAERVAAMKVPVITWVGPAPAKASGAGLLLMYASSLAAVSPGSQTGPLYPLDLSHPSLRIPGLAATVNGWIAARGATTRTDWIDRPLDAAEARHLGIAQVTALSVPALLDLIDGRRVSTAGGEVTLDTRVATTQAEAQQGTVLVRFEQLGPVKRVEHGVSSPSMIYFLLVLGLACVAFETTQPGFGFAGFAGVGMLALAVYGLTVVPVSWLGLALLVAGVGLMVLDVRLRRLGPFTAIGLVAFGVGSTLAWHGVAEAIRVSPWLIGGAIVASLLYYGFGLTVAIQSRDRIVSTQRGLIGLVGEARGALSPEGPVFVKGTLWRGRATEGSIEPGARVRVRGIDGLVLRVEVEPATADEAGPA